MSYERCDNSDVELNIERRCLMSNEQHLGSFGQKVPFIGAF